TAPDGSFTARVPAAAYLVRAEIADTARSAPLAVELTAAGAHELTLLLPEPAVFDVSIIDDETGSPIPGALTVLGRHPAPPDRRLFPMHDRAFGVVRTMHMIRGTTVDIGDGADPRLELPAGPEGATYRVFASRGTEWSIASQL